MTLTKEQFEHFKEEGYVVLEAALQDVDFEPVIQDYKGVIDTLAKDLYANSRISQLYADEPFETRLARICDEDEATYFESDTFLDVGHIRGKGTFHFMRNKRLLDLIEGAYRSRDLLQPYDTYTGKAAFGPRARAELKCGLLAPRCDILPRGSRRNLRPDRLDPFV